MGSIVSLWWASLSQETVTALVGVVVLSWVVGLVSRRGKSDKKMLDESVLLGCFLVRSIVDFVEVSM